MTTSIERFVNGYLTPNRVALYTTYNLLDYLRAIGEIDSPQAMLEEVKSMMNDLNEITKQTHKDVTNG